MDPYNLPWNPYGLDEYGHTALGAVAARSSLLATPADPIFGFGQKGARVIMQEARKLPLGERKIFMQAVLEVLDPTLYRVAGEKATKLVRDKRMSSGQALEKALAVGMANGLASETLKRVQGRPTATGYIDLAGIVSRAKRAVRGAGKAVSRSAKKAGKAVSRATKKAGKAAAGALKKIGGLACAALNSGLAQNALAAAIPGGGLALKAGGKILAERSGEQLAASATKHGQSLCAGQAAPEPPPSAATSMVLPVVAGGGLLALLLLL